jgi:hypothetical protein
VSVATVDVPLGQADPAAFRVSLRVTNQTARSTSVLNPDMGAPTPDTKWPYSNEVYQTSLLLSFHFLTIVISDESGHDLPQQPVATWATPVVLPKLELPAGASLELTIPLGTFYRLESGRTYRVAMRYGDREQTVSVQTAVRVP